MTPQGASYSKNPTRYREIPKHIHTVIHWLEQAWRPCHECTRITLLATDFESRPSLPPANAACRFLHIVVLPLQLSSSITWRPQSSVKFVATAAVCNRPACLLFELLCPLLVYTQNLNLPQAASALPVQHVNASALPSASPPYQSACLHDVPASVSPATSFIAGMAASLVLHSSCQHPSALTSHNTFVGPWMWTRGQLNNSKPWGIVTNNKTLKINMAYFQSYQGYQIP